MSNINYINCSACLQLSKATQQDDFPDNGWALPHEWFGYYGGFSDSLEFAFGSRQSKLWILCHDCVVKFFNLFPNLANTYGLRHHPCSDDVPCCRFAWRGTENFAKCYNEELVRTQHPELDQSTLSLVWVDDLPEKNI